MHKLSGKPDLMYKSRNLKRLRLFSFMSELEKGIIRYLTFFFLDIPRLESSTKILSEKAWGADVFCVRFRDSGIALPGRKGTWKEISTVSRKGNTRLFRGLFLSKTFRYSSMILVLGQSSFGRDKRNEVYPTAGSFFVCDG